MQRAMRRPQRQVQIARIIARRVDRAEMEREAVLQQVIKELRRHIPGTTI